MVYGCSFDLGVPLTMNMVSAYVGAGISGRKISVLQPILESMIEIILPIVIAMVVIRMIFTLVGSFTGLGSYAPSKPVGDYIVVEKKLTDVDIEKGMDVVNKEYRRKRRSKMIYIPSKPIGLPVCQVCNDTELIDVGMMKCQKCDRVVHVKCFEEGQKVGMSACPLCYGTMVRINE